MLYGKNPQVDSNILKTLKDINIIELKSFTTQ